MVLQLSQGTGSGRFAGQAVYVLFLGRDRVALMFVESAEQRSEREKKGQGAQSQENTTDPRFCRLKMRFRVSGLYISVIPPLIVRVL